MLSSNDPSAELHAVSAYAASQGKKIVEVCRFEKIARHYAYNSNRHKFDFVIWATKGSGIHDVDCKSYEMVPGRLFFIRAGQVHQIKQYADDGWAILLSEVALKNLNSSLLDNFYGRPYLDLKEVSCETFMGLFSLLQLEMKQSEPNVMMIVNLLNGMLLCADQRNSSPATVTDDRFAVIKRLKSLIDNEYKRHKYPEFYCDALGLSGRRINNITKSVLGKTLYELLQDKLLVEGKSLLSGSSLTVKEIAAELEFNSSGYFCRFFKKMTGITALDYRASVQSGSSSRS